MIDEEANTDQSTVEAPPPYSPLFTSETALSFKEARTLTGRRGATLVLPVGEVGAGKTTLLVELWSLLLLDGSISTQTLRALAQRWHSRSVLITHESSQELMLPR